MLGLTCASYISSAARAAAARAAWRFAWAKATKTWPDAFHALATDATLCGELALRGQASVCEHFDAPVMVQAFGDLLERLQ